MLEVRQCCWLGRKRKRVCKSTELRYLKWRSRNDWFSISMLFLINGKDAQAGLVGFLPFQHTTEPKNPKPQTSGYSVLRFCEISIF